MCVDLDTLIYCINKKKEKKKKTMNHYDAAQMGTEVGKKENFFNGKQRK